MGHPRRLCLWAGGRGFRIDSGLPTTRGLIAGQARCLRHEVIPFRDARRPRSRESVFGGAFSQKVDGADSGIFNHIPVNTILGQQCHAGTSSPFAAQNGTGLHLLSDAEGAEDQVEDVVGGGGAGDFVEGAEGSVEVEQKHLVRDAGGDGVGRVVERGEGVVD
jgi:hypothetical protein